MRKNVTMRINPIFRLFALLILGTYLPFLWAQPSEVKLVVNQTGYDMGGVKRVWIQTSFPPASISSFQIMNGDQVVHTGIWAEEIQLWGRWYLMGDFSDFSIPGEFRVRVQWEGNYGQSPPFVIDSKRRLRWSGPLAVRFFSIQRCGTEVLGWHAPCHLDDARMPDNSSRNLTGGWHDAGDYNKYNGFTPLAVYALAKFSGNQTVQSLAWDVEFPTPLEEALWGASWLRKAQDPQTKKIIGSVFSGFGYWGPPELETDNIPGNLDDRPALVYEWSENEMTVAAYAALFGLTQDSTWKKDALELWDVVVSQGPPTSVFQGAKRLLAAVEVYRITNDNRVLKDAEESAKFLALAQETDGSWPKWYSFLIDSGLPAAALAELMLAAPQNEAADVIIEALKRHLQHWDRLRLSPFDIPKWSDTDFFYPYSLDEWYVGQNGMYLSQAWAGALLSKVFPQDRPRIIQWTQGCLDWITGANPLGICMMYGAGTNHLFRYHHRYDSIANGSGGNVPGAICNGITRESPESDMPYLDLIGNAWQTNEPWLPHNAFYLLAIHHMETTSKKGVQRR
jgi:hypothetical protein